MKHKSIKRFASKKVSVRFAGNATILINYLHRCFIHCVEFLMKIGHYFSLRPFSISVALPARAERKILITWKISRACMSRKLNVVLLSWRVREHSGGQKMHRIDNYRESWVMFAPPARAKRLHAMENCLELFFVIVSRVRCIFDLSSLNTVECLKDWWNELLRTLVGYLELD